MDGDGDMDVLSASGNDDKIAWYENNGSESFTAHTITTSADNAETVFAVDVDGDGDIDVLSASVNDDKIAWYEAAIDNTAPLFHLSLRLTVPREFLPLPTWSSRLMRKWMRNQAISPYTNQTTHRFKRLMSLQIFLVRAVLPLPSIQLQTWLNRHPTMYR